VTKRFGATVALRDVTLAITAGESLALVGRNGAGKSTLVRILTGLSMPDAGEVRLNGQPAPDIAQRDRWRALVACVYQHSTVIGGLTVAENLFLNDHPTRRGGMVHWKRLRLQARALLDEWQLDLPPDAPADRLSVDQRQLVEIARALRLGTRCVILDEPTARLEGREQRRLFEQMRRLTARGVTFLYISHHLEEVYEVCERVAVLRDGRLVAAAPVAQMDKQRLVGAMVGDERATPADPDTPSADWETPPADRPVALEVTGLTVDGWCRGVDVTVHAGERVGLAGLAGSGKAQVADAIVGMLRYQAGTVRVGDAPLGGGRVDKAIGRGVGYVPEDRHARGFCPNLPVADNLAASILRRLASWGIVTPRRVDQAAGTLMDQLEIVASSPRQRSAELSGGNQQKSVMGRALASEPSVLVLVSPTAGVDIASKTALLKAIERSDAAILLVSDELDELAICDRVLVMLDGRVVRELGSVWQDHELVAAMEGVGRR
jgi:simple sugar transport system ATP-binding protein